MKGGENMITQNFTSVAMAQSTQPPFEIKSAPKSKESSSRDFKSVMSSTMTKPTNSSTTVVSSQNMSQNKEQTESSVNNQKSDITVSKKELKTFKEAAALEKQTTTVDKPKNNKNLESKGEAVEASDTDSKMVVENSQLQVTQSDQDQITMLAQMLGVNVSDMKMIFDKLDLKPETLKDTKQLTEIVNKLADFLSLDSQQKLMLSNIIKAIQTPQEQNSYSASSLQTQKTETEALLDSSSQSVLQKPAELVDPANANIEVIVKNPNNFNLSEIASKIKMKLDELSLNSTQIQTTVQQEAQVAKVNTQTAEVKTQDISINKADVASTDPKEVNTEKVSLMSSNTENSKDTRGESSSLPFEEPKASKAEIIEPIAEKSGTVQGFQLNGQIPVQSLKVNEVVPAVNLQKMEPVQKADIVNQVVEKAKIILDGGKSEMVMQLKPDSLGKVELKVVTEQGLVAAKFIAENEQVKAVLETNMQLLKDTLEKQGMAVQELSVSVQRDTSGGFFNNRGNKENGDERRSTQGISSVDGVAAARIAASQQRINPYEWSESSINLTA
jgi:flagellar hook-length control protein FliK